MFPYYPYQVLTISLSPKIQNGFIFDAHINPPLSRLHLHIYVTFPYLSLQRLTTRLWDSTIFQGFPSLMRNPGGPEDPVEHFRTIQALTNHIESVDNFRLRLTTSYYDDTPFSHTAGGSSNHA